MKFAIWKLRVCLHCLWHLRLWPWSHLSDRDWRESFEDESDPWRAFLEGWCCDNDPADTGANNGE